MAAGPELLQVDQADLVPVADVDLRELVRVVGRGAAVDGCDRAYASRLEDDRAIDAVLLVGQQGPPCPPAHPAPDCRQEMLQPTRNPSASR